MTDAPRIEIPLSAEGTSRAVDISVDSAGRVSAGPPVPSKVVIAHHIAPLVVLLVYGGLFVWFMIYTTLWFVKLKSADQTVNVTAWIGATQTMMAGLAALVFKFYTERGLPDDHH